MEEGREATQKQRAGKLERKCNELAKLQEIFNRNPLPDTMEITIIVLFKIPDGPFAETGVLHLHHVMDKKMTVKPSTTVGEMKDFVLEMMPALEYNRMEIGYGGQHLPDNMTVKQINYRWPFMNEKTLELMILSRNRMYKKLYKYFIDMGISQQKAKKETETVMQFMVNGVDNDVEKAENLKICAVGYEELIELFPFFLT